MSVNLNDRALRRREFLVSTATAIAATGIRAQSLVAADSGDSPRVPLGLDGHSLRGMKWKAAQLVEFAAEQRLDAVLLNNLISNSARPIPFLTDAHWRGYPNLKAAGIVDFL